MTTKEPPQMAAEPARASFQTPWGMFFSTEFMRSIVRDG